ncbi:uncharacterized protein Z518_05399 [Rhinocladiella mackenziei CBS 650.93]|uniref:Uncharacterized protein n=1 Tax=Rhinocladiella mackenziei CBS 650.93 TaxID=1442369 RepID=A0A0D2IFF7_9EURO|nr:uncharacterized protein Z518_05399 [Rhinocladiella mackenziei CBS 650.93]KIX04529.1 hypothetical protein Z518_05399 [Rhinocladiella mackenziei CBS 650.93]
MSFWPLRLVNRHLESDNSPKPEESSERLPLPPADLVLPSDNEQDASNAEIQSSTGPIPVSPSEGNLVLSQSESSSDTHGEMVQASVAHGVEEVESPSQGDGANQTSSPPLTQVPPAPPLPKDEVSGKEPGTSSVNPSEEMVVSNLVETLHSSESSLGQSSKEQILLAQQYIAVNPSTNFGQPELAKSLDPMEQLSNPLHDQNQLSEPPQPSNEDQKTSSGLALELNDKESHGGVPDSDDRSVSLRRKWYQLNSLMDSFSTNLIFAGDLRRDITETRERALQSIDAFMASSKDPILQDLWNSLSALQASEQKLKVADEELIHQGYEARAQGSKIFGQSAPESFQILDQQGIIVQSQDSEDDDSALLADDIRCDQTYEAQLYLSKMGDVDLLKESLMEVDAELHLVEKSDILDDHEPELRSRQQELLEQLDKAENDLTVLRDNLPERKVDIPEEQLRPPGEEEEAVLGASDVSERPAQDHNQDPEADSQFLLGPQKGGLLSILEKVTDDDHIKYDTLVNAYLLHQLRVSFKEQEELAKTLREVAQDTNQPVETDPKLLKLDHWFEEERKSKSSKLLTRAFFSDDMSIATHAEPSQLTHGISEPNEPRKPHRFHTGDNMQRLNLYSRNQKGGAMSLR